MLHSKNIVSFFDGMGCGRIAIDAIGLPFDNYYTSEIDKDAIAVTQFHYPDNIALGDARHHIDLKGIKDVFLLLGGSPCQSFSIGNTARNGFESDNGKLFYIYLKAIKQLNPAYFLYENVATMKNADRDFISKSLGVQPLKLDSGLVSAQSRNRYYWTNIKVPPLANKGLILADIIEKNALMRTFDGGIFDNENKPINPNKANRIGYIKNMNRGHRIYSINGKSICLTKSGGGIGSKTGLYLIDGNVRRLTVNECEALQSVPKDFTKYGLYNGVIKQVSDNQRYGMLGNGWTVDIIIHILMQLLNNGTNVATDKPLTLF